MFKTIEGKKEEEKNKLKKMHQVKGILNGSLDLASSSFGLKYFSFEKCIDHLPLLSTKHRQRKEKG